MSVPNLIKFHDIFIQCHDFYLYDGRINRLVPARSRPVPMEKYPIRPRWNGAGPRKDDHGLLHRLKLAWGVFVGKYDALFWPEDEKKII